MHILSDSGVKFLSLIHTSKQNHLKMHRYREKNGFPLILEGNIGNGMEIEAKLLIGTAMAQK